jgi:hypothetical protein
MSVWFFSMAKWSAVFPELQRQRAIKMMAGWARRQQHLSVNEKSAFDSINSRQILRRFANTENMRGVLLLTKTMNVLR